MRKLLLKEMKLSASVPACCFIGFGLMFFLPGYPVLCGAFFSTLGIFQSFLYAAEANDIVFSVLLPIAKRDVVKGKYGFVTMIELCTVIVMSIATVMRMTVFADAAAYRSNALMNANLFALGAALFIFGLFNCLFVGGFFKTAYKIRAPFIIYTVAAFLCIGVFETLHHIPGLEALNAFGTECATLQASALLAGAAAWLLMTLASYSRACACFEKIDL